MSHKKIFCNSRIYFLFTRKASIVLQDEMRSIVLQIHNTIVLQEVELD